jgi:hypothetical protein
MTAYTLAARENINKIDYEFDNYLYLEDDKVIHRALRLVNMAISEKAYKEWYKKVRPRL